MLPRTLLLSIIAMVWMSAIRAETLVLTSTDDSHIRAIQTNQGDNSLILVGDTANANDYLRACLAFDLSAPELSSAIITSVTLTLTIGDKKDNDSPSQVNALDVHEFSTSFTNNGVTWTSRDGTNNWTNPGGDFGAALASVAANAGSVGVDTSFSFNSAALTSASTDAQGGSLYLLVKLATEDAHRSIFRFGSKDYAGSAPTLTIEYQTVVVDPILRQDLATGDPDLNFGTFTGDAPVSATRTLHFVNDGPSNPITIESASFTGSDVFSLDDVSVNGSGRQSLPLTLQVGDQLALDVTASFSGYLPLAQATLTLDTSGDFQDRQLDATALFPEPGTGYPDGANVLIVMADDWGWPHAGVYGANKETGPAWIETPHFDTLASQGVLFNNGFANAPSCTAARGSALTGLHPWKLSTGATIYGTLPGRLATYADILANEDVKVGYTGKAWGPGPISAGGRSSDPAGVAYNTKKRTPLTGGMSNIDYVANFVDFLDDRAPGQPFCFWLGQFEPHRPYTAYSGVNKGGLDPASVVLPSYYPDHSKVRNDFLDYALEVKDLDATLGAAIAHLDTIGELDNTLIIVTGDNGMPFPREKKNLYEKGVHVPFAIRWGDRVLVPNRNRVVDDPVTFVDIAPTILEAMGVTAPEGVHFDGSSLLDLLDASGSGVLTPNLRPYAYFGIDRHGAVPANEAISGAAGAGYPMRAIRGQQFLYIRNFEPDWYPYIPDAGLTTTHLESLNGGSAQDQQYYDWSFGTRPLEELFDIVVDPDCVNNLAANPAYAADKERLWTALEEKLRETRDPRILGYGDLFFANPFYKTGSARFSDWDTRVATFLNEPGNTGMPHALEIILGSDLPDAADAIQVFTDESGSGVRFRISRVASDISSSSYEWSSDLSTNSWSPDLAPAQWTESDSNFDWFEARPVDGSALRGFFRITSDIDTTNP